MASKLQVGDLEVAVVRKDIKNVHLSILPPVGKVRISAPKQVQNLWGKRYLLKIVEKDGPPGVERTHRQLILQIRPGASQEKREEILAGWYRDQLRKAVPPLIARWEPMRGVEVADFFLQHMKTKWGGCSPERKTIRLNTELAKKPPECLEYLVVHEMTHLLEPTHNERFIGLMDRFMPNWRTRRDLLNSLPVRYESWRY